MKHEDFYSDYNDVMYNERDVIQNFLDKTANVCYGNQMYCYCLNDLQVIASNGAIYYCYEVFRDKDCFVKFRVKSCENHHEVWEAHNFAYGELSKIIDALPEVDEFKMINVNTDIKKWTKECSVSLEENPFVWKNGDSKFEVHEVFYSDVEKKILYEIKETSTSANGWGLWEELPAEVMLKLHSHMASEILRRSPYYEKIKNTLNNDVADNRRYVNLVEREEVGCLTISPIGTDIDLAVLDVSFDEDGLNVLVSTSGTTISEVEDTLNLTESDLDEGCLKDIVKYLNSMNIMDTSQNHDPELVKKINEEWNKDCDMFAPILYAIAERDEVELREKGIHVVTYNDAIECAEGILMRVCDNLDLQTILNFLRCV